VTSPGGRRIGWLGGSFDPIHDGHLAIARRALDHLRLERVLLVVAAQPPHKPGRRLAPAEQRLQLVRLAIAGDPRLQACDVELQRSGPSYSVDTAAALHEHFGRGLELFFILGADMLADLPQWHRVGELCRRVTFCAVTRPGTPLDPEPMARIGGAPLVASIRAHLLEMEPHPASSTAVREALARGETPPHLPPAVAAEVRRLGLYGAGGFSDSDVSGAETWKP